ncbi:hypothetical protein HanXRQr2_Chr05g0195371 [Helianthus annuus]|uniref:Uncharacterized protein n=1 Tax=Helianthus annuus TaxID=4232 RepID=A0A9K3IWJ9_HELAN|nr:hypothetical protein HanXRQr2_Chr05g0195361 [Helianthus annuus]KAF5804288.1 hypothetical protein HanXRQr2_Chr05g0195371 [Helianthus annuus]
MSWIELFKYHNLSINLGACMTPLDEANVSSQALADETTWRFAIISPTKLMCFVIWTSGPGGSGPTIC